MIATALLWSIGGIVIKLVPWNPLAIAGLRGVLGGLVMYAYLRIRGIKPALNKGHDKDRDCACGRLLHVCCGKQAHDLR